jgi:pimeloyl-ACP methyl ester carboxylesterase
MDNENAPSLKSPRRTPRLPLPAPRPRLGGSSRAGGLLDGPFAETKELVVAAWPRGADGGRALPPGRYASVNGLRMYYEVHGSGRPLVVLHAALSTIDASFAAILPVLARSRRVIAIEQQAHGRTPDIARPVSYRQMGLDTVELLRQLGITRADFFGFSMGVVTALEIALEHPQLVRKLLLVSGLYSPSGCMPEFLEAVKQLGQCGTEHEDQLKKNFERVGARPQQWPRALRRVQELFECDQGLRPEQLGSIRADTLIVSGEYGVIRPEHTSQMARLVPNAKLERLPGNDHAPSLLTRSAALADTFLDPMGPNH